MSEHANPKLAADAVLLKGDEILLVRRGREPFRGAWALPGGFVEVGETVERACLRELAEETAMKGVIVDLLGVYSEPDRDPRHHTVSVAYVCGVAGVLVGLAAGARSAVADARRPFAPAPASAVAGDDADDARWFPLAEVPPLAFDHSRIVADARAWLSSGGLRLLVEATDTC